MLFEKVPTRYCKKLDVYVQGDIRSGRAGKTVFLTVHDVGTDYTSIASFIDDPHMAEVKRKSIFIHVSLPGQTCDSAQLSDEYEFPNLDCLAHDLTDVLDNFNVRMVIGLGEGAGANILCRFGLYHPNRCLGLILIDCVTNAASVDEYIQGAVVSWKEGGNKLLDKFLKILPHHKLNRSFHERRELTFDEDEPSLNLHNLKKYLEVYIKRSDISTLLAENLKCEVLVVTGAWSPNYENVYKTVEPMNKIYATFLAVDEVVDVISQATRKQKRRVTLEYLPRYPHGEIIVQNETEKLRVETLLVVGSKMRQLRVVYNINRRYPTLTTVMTVDAVAEVMQEDPLNLARALILFCKGCGVLLGIPMIGLEREFMTLKIHQKANQAVKEMVLDLAEE